MKAKVLSTFIGTPEEVAKFGGQIPEEFKKREKRMSDAERNSFRGVITAGTEIDVDDKRAHALASVGIIEIKGAKAEDYHTRDTDSKANVRTVEKVTDEKVKEEKGTEKVKDAGPNAKK